MPTNLEKLIEHGGWRPIEDAPKDGTSILVRGGAAHWVDGGWKSERSNLQIQWEVMDYMPLDTPERMARVAAVQHKALMQCANVSIGTLEKALIAKRAIAEAEQIAGETP